MEGKIILQFAFAMLGLFTSLMATRLDILASILVLGGFALIAIDRLVLLSFIQLKRLTEKQYKVHKILGIVFPLLLLMGLLFGKILPGDTIFSIPFGYFFQLSLAYTICVILSIKMLFVSYNESHLDTSTNS